jgi:hypothetical protein
MSTTVSSEVYGYRVVYERCSRNGAGLEQAWFRCKTPHVSKAQYVARFKIGFIRVIEAEPYTEEQYVRVFGRGRM